MSERKKSLLEDASLCNYESSLVMNKEQFKDLRSIVVTLLTISREERSLFENRPTVKEVITRTLTVNLQTAFQQQTVTQKEL